MERRLTFLSAVPIAYFLAIGYVAPLAQSLLRLIKRTGTVFRCFSGGRAIGPGGATRRLGVSRGGGADVTIEGGSGQQYLMSQGGERISSGKSSIFNGVEVGKEVSTKRHGVKPPVQGCFS